MTLLLKGTLTILTGNGGGDCGFRFIEGQSYIVYGERDNYLFDVEDGIKTTRFKDAYWTNICTKTQQFNQDEADSIAKETK